MAVMTVAAGASVSRTARTAQTRPTTPRPAPTAARADVRLTPRGRRLVRTGTALGLVLLFVVGALVANASTSFADAPGQTRAVVVQPGETLWGIASVALPGLDTREAVQVLRDLNGVGTELRPGQQILVPLG